MLEWGRSIGHDFDYYCYVEAIFSENYDMLVHLHKIGCPVNVNYQDRHLSTPESAAVEVGNANIIKFMLQHGETFSSTLILEKMVAAGKSSEVLKILEERPELWSEDIESMLRTVRG